MHLLVICALIIGLPSFLLIGLLHVVHNLLSRDGFEAPSWSNTDAPETREGVQGIGAPET
jgi:hypothetical protein